MRVHRLLGVCVATLAVASPGGFGRGGWVVTEIGRDASAAAVEVGSDGRIVAAGSSGGDFAVTRYDVDGRLERIFAQVDFGRTDAAGTVAFQNGLTLVGGSACTVNAGIATADSAGPCGFALVRYTLDGKPDPRFGRDGKTLTTFGATRFSITALVPRRDGTVLAAGGGAAFATVIKNHRVLPAGALRVGGALVRYTSNGRLDQRFGNGGIALVPFAVVRNGLTVLPDGRILVVGFSSTWGPSVERYTLVLARYTAAGRPDNGWGVGGIRALDFARRGGVGAAAAAFQHDGRIVVLADSARGLTLSRYGSDGRPDVTFGHAGTTTAVLTGADGYVDAGEIALASGGEIVAVGTATGSFAVARFNHNGALDTAFGTRGKTIAYLGNNDVEAAALAVQADGKILAAGDVQLGNRTSFAIARFTSSGRLDR